MDALKKVQSGQKLVIPAAAFNSFIDAANDLRQRQACGVSRGVQGDTPAQYVLVKNASGADLDRFGVLGIDGPVIFPVAGDLPFLAQPITPAERAKAEALARESGAPALERSLPISVVGTGPDLNSAIENGLGRAATLLGMEVPEVMNRATISGGIEIGRAPGVIQVTFRAPIGALEKAGLADLAIEQYGEPA